MRHRHTNTDPQDSLNCSPAGNVSESRCDAQYRELAGWSYMAKENKIDVETLKTGCSYPGNIKFVFWIGSLFSWKRAHTDEDALPRYRDVLALKPCRGRCLWNRESWMPLASLLEKWNHPMLYTRDFRIENWWHCSLLKQGYILQMICTLFVAHPLAI